MMFGLAEGLVRALKAYLETNLPAKLAALNAEYNDAVVLEETRITYLGIKSLAAIPEYPILYIVSTEAAIEPWHVEASGQAQIMSKPRVYVGIVVDDPEEEPIQLRQYRYGRALVELLLEGLGTVSTAEWNLAPSEDWSVDYVSAGLLDREGQVSKFIGAAEVGLRATKIETK